MRRFIFLLLFLLSTVPAWAVDYTADADCVFAVKMDETSGAVVDACGSNDGTATGATQNQTGKFGKAISFDGDNDKVDFGDVTFLDGLSAFSVCWYMKLEAQSTTASVIRKDGSWTPLQTNASGKFGGALWTSSYEDFDFGNTLDTDNDWHHYCVTYDGSNAKGYVDAVQVGTSNADTGSIANGSAVFVIGATESDTEEFTGLLDELIIFDRVISSGDMEALRDSGITPVVSCDTTCSECSTFATCKASASSCYWFDKACSETAGTFQTEIK